MALFETSLFILSLGTCALEVQMPVPVIEHDDLEIGKFLGAGAEGAVWAAWYQETPVAVKKTDSLNEVYI